ncbi:unnamed protein product, partial [Prorocentrum cordatum]
GALQMEPRNRLAAREALRAPWFAGVALPRSVEDRAVSLAAAPAPAVPPPAPRTEEPQRWQPQLAPPQQPQHHHPVHTGVLQRGEDSYERQQPDEPRAPLRGLPPPRESPAQREQPEEPTRGGFHSEAPRPNARGGDELRQALHVDAPRPNTRGGEEPRQGLHAEPLRPGTRGGEEPPVRVRGDPRAADLHGADPARPNTRGAEDHRTRGDELRGTEPMFGSHGPQFSPPQPPHQMNRPAYLLPWEASGPEDGRHHTETSAASGWDADDKGADGRRSRRRPGTGELVSGDRPSPAAGSIAVEQRAAVAAARHNPSAGTGGSEEWPFAPSRVPAWLREQEPEDDAPALFAAPCGGAGPSHPGRRNPSRQQPGALANPPPAPAARRSPEVPMPVELGMSDLPGGLSGLPSIHGGISGISGISLSHQSSSLSHPNSLLSDSSRVRERGQMDSSRVREEDLARQLWSNSVGRWNCPPDWQHLGAPGPASGHGHGPAELAPVRDARGGLLHEAREQRQLEGRGSLAGALGRREPSNTYLGH